MKITIIGRLVASTVTIGVLLTGSIENVNSAAPQKPEKTVAIERVWGPETRGCKISIELEKEKYSYCTPIVLKLYIKNAGKQPLTFRMQNKNTDFELIVKDQWGKVVPLTRFGKSVMGSGVNFGRSATTLAPGEESKHTILVNLIHDMTLGVEYSIMAKRKVLKRDEEGNLIKDENGYQEFEVISNTVTCRVAG